MPGGCALCRLSNLIENAVRPSEPGMMVTVWAETGDGELVLLVGDMIGPQAAVPGAAGFGLDVAGRIATVLGAREIKDDSGRGLAVPLPKMGNAG